VSRPIDRLPGFLRHTFGRTREESISQGVCIRCGRPPGAMTEIDRREYEISAVCPSCWHDLFGEDT